VNILFVSETDFLKKVVFDVHLLPEAMSLRGHRYSCFIMKVCGGKVITLKTYG